MYSTASRPLFFYFNYILLKLVCSIDINVFLTIAQDEASSSGLSDVVVVGLVLGLLCCILMIAVAFVLGLLLGKYLQKRRDCVKIQAKESPEYATIVPSSSDNRQHIARVTHLELSSSPVQNDEGPVYETPDLPGQRQQSGDLNRPHSESNNNVSLITDGKRTAQSQEPLYHVLENSSANYIVQQM